MRGFVLRSCPPRPAPTPAGMTLGSSICCCLVLPGISQARPSLLLTPTAPACPSTAQLWLSGIPLALLRSFPYRASRYSFPSLRSPWEGGRGKSLFCFVINEISPWEYYLHRCQRGRSATRAGVNKPTPGGCSRDALPAPGDCHTEANEILQLTGTFGAKTTGKG